MTFCFADRLKKAMKDNGISQEKLAAAVGLKRQTISQYMAGETTPNAAVLYGICEKLHVSADYLIGRDPELTEYMRSVIAEQYTGLTFETIGLFHSINIHRSAYADEDGASEALTRLYKRQLAAAIIQGVHDLAEGGGE